MREGGKAKKEVRRTAACLIRPGKGERSRIPAFPLSGGVYAPERFNLLMSSLSKKCFSYKERSTLGTALSASGTLKKSEGLKLNIPAMILLGKTWILVLYPITLSL
jgi:hypothetical protein